MHRLLILVIAVSLIAGCQRKDERQVADGPAITIRRSEQEVTDAVRLTPGGAVSYSSGSTDPAIRATAVRKALAEARPGDKVVIGVGTFDFGHADGNVILPDQVTVSGQGRERTKLLGSVWSDEQGTQFVLQSTVVTDLTMECKTYKDGSDGKEPEDGRTVGFDQLPGPFTARVERCRIVGNAWTVYSWNNFGHHLRLEDCEIVSGRQCVSAMGSGGENAGSIDIVRCVLDGDAQRSSDIGATSNAQYGGVFGVMARGGVVRIIDSEIRLKGAAEPFKHSFCPRVAGVSDTFESGPSGQTRIEIFDTRFAVEANGSASALDIDLRDKAVRKNARISGCWGSGPEGKLLESAGK